MSTYIVGISGASGAPYAVRLVELLARSGAQVFVTASSAGLEILREESALRLDAAGGPDLASLWPEPAVRQKLAWCPADTMQSPIASGSNPWEAMIVCPCSMNTLAAVACGLSDNLLQRAAAVTLKERRRLILVPRETPLADMHLENMLRLSRSGASIVPAMPAFYHHPQSVADLVDFVVVRVLQLLGVPHDLDIRWNPDGGR
jgi:4-hydroxy-3-polyprenylbenzoate decarboxylase